MARNVFLELLDKNKNRFAASGLVVLSPPQPPKPPRKSCSTKPTTTDVHEGLQSVYEDLDVFQVNPEPG